MKIKFRNRIIKMLVVAMLLPTILISCDQANMDNSGATSTPTQTVTEAPTEAPTSEPTESPAETDTEAPTTAPTNSPAPITTEAPTTAATVAPAPITTESSTEAQTEASTPAPTQAPTETLTEAQTEASTQDQTEAPTQNQTEAPVEIPTEEPTEPKPTSPNETPVKYFTLSLDDATTQDRRIVEILRKYNVTCCSFNINTGLYGVDWSEAVSNMVSTNVSHVRLTEEEINSGIYDGFDVLVHTKTHASLKNLKRSGIIEEVQGDADNIAAITGVKPVGMAWPGGDTEYTQQNIKDILKYTDIRFARCITPTYGFTLPKRFMEWYPTCNFSDKRVFELAEQFINAEATEDMLFYVWGHGFEFDLPGYHSYDEFEQLVKMMSEAEDVVLVTNTEFYNIYKDYIPS